MTISCQSKLPDCPLQTVAGLLRLGSVQLIAAANPAHSLAIDDRVVDRKSKVTGNAEDISDPNILKAR
jgi:hypothetical protein